MGTVFDILNFEQGTALLEEATSVANLLQDGVEAVQSLRQPDLHRDAVFALASIGVERLLKLAIGADYLDTEQRWPSTKEMKKFGHNLDALQERAFEIVRTRGALTPYVQNLVDFLDSSPTLTALLSALSHYGQSGRFFHLDTLGKGKRDKRFSSPSQHWIGIEEIALVEFPDVKNAVEDDLESGLAALAQLIASLLDQWWFAHHRILINQGFGRYGKQIGWLIMPPEKKDPFIQPV